MAQVGYKCRGKTIVMSPDAPMPAPPQASRRQLQILAAILAVAAAIYSYRIGRDPLGASEAYSAWAASKPGIAAIAGTPIAHDPGKQLLYYLLLHYFAAVFGTGEIALHAFSVIFALADVALVFAIGREMFGAETGLAAAAVWALSPLAVAFAHTARMYPLFIAIALAHLLMLWRLRERPTPARIVASAVLGAAMPYTHIAGLLILGAEAAMLTRDAARGRRNPMAWLALSLAIAMFVPYAPIAARQSNDLLFGHSIDYFGAPYAIAPAAKAATAIAAAAVVAWLVFGGAIEGGAREPLRWLIGWIGMPALAFGAGSLLVRPMWNLRYISPGIAALTVLIAGAIALYSAKIRNLAAAGFALACLILVKFDFAPAPPWRDFAEQVAAEGGASQPVFFESGYIPAAAAANVPTGGYPFGYYSVPFNYYFHGPNPRVRLPGYDSAAARIAIESRVSAAGGGWLVSWKDAAAIESELPDPAHFRSVEIYQDPVLAIYRITPRPTPPAPPRKAVQTE